MISVEARCCGVTAAELAANSSNSAGLLGRHARCRGLNRTYSAQFRPCRSSKGLDPGYAQVNQPFQVVAGRHHCHPEVGACLANGANQHATHLIHRSEHMLNTGANLGNAVIASLLALGQGAVTRTFTLNLGTVPPFFELRFPCLAGIAPIGIHILTGVAGIEYRVEMPTVVHRGSIGLKPADHLVALVHIDRQLVAEVALAMLFGPAGIQVFLPALGRCPVGGCRLLLDDLLLLAADLLLGRGYQGRVNDLTATCDVALAQ